MRKKRKSEEKETKYRPWLSCIFPNMFIYILFDVFDVVDDE